MVPLIPLEASGSVIGLVLPLRGVGVKVAGRAISGQVRGSGPSSLGYSGGGQGCVEFQGTSWGFPYRLGSIGIPILLGAVKSRLRRGTCTCFYMVGDFFRVGVLEGSLIGIYIVLDDL